MSAGEVLGRRPILPVELRRPAGAVAVVAVLVFGVFAERYENGSTAGRLDRRLQSLVGTSGPGRSLADAVILLGNELSVVVLAALLAALALALGHRRLAVLAIVGPGLSGAATVVLKPLIGRSFNGAFAYPSGHAAGVTALGVVAALLLVGVLRTNRTASATIVAAGALVPGGAMAIALIADREHYPTDTLGGFCIAVSLVLASALAIEWWAERSTRRRGPAAPRSPDPAQD
jgi:membrane-associated phospholipid phosphatase